MTEYTMQKAKERRIPTTSTPEDLEGRFAYGSGKTVTFGDLTIVAGYYHRGRNEDGYYWAAYRNEGGIEDNTNLEAVSNEFYGDDGHALEAAFGWAAQWA